MSEFTERLACGALPISSTSCRWSVRAQWSAPFLRQHIHWTVWCFALPIPYGLVLYAIHAGRAGPLVFLGVVVNAVAVFSYDGFVPVALSGLAGLIFFFPCWAFPRWSRYST